MRSLYESLWMWPFAPCPFSRRGVLSVGGIAMVDGEGNQMEGG